MPWTRTDWMAERVKFIAAYLGCEACFSDLCRDFGVSRRTGYKWVRRFKAEGAGALEDRNLSTTLRHSLREFTEQPLCIGPRA
jgi:transposase-like protein